MNFEQIRQEFPVLHQKVNGKPLVYLDNAATTQKPLAVISALESYYKLHNSNIHRGAHTLADRATQLFEDTRKEIAKFIQTPDEACCIFTKGVTESINLVANAWGRKFLREGDEILLTQMEHHSNIVPWQMVASATGAVIKVVPVLDNGELDLLAFQQLLNAKTKMVACVWASNALGTINPVSTIVKLAHEHGSLVILDGAQAGSHIEIDVTSLDVDFLTISAHKLYGPTGVGVLYGKRHLLEAMDPYQGGGEMIKEVSFDGTTYNQIPFKFEAGTPNIGDVIAFKEALQFVNGIGKSAIVAHEQQLLEIAYNGLSKIGKIQFLGTAREKVAVQSFNIEGKHPFDVGFLLDAKGIAVRTGHHCTQPLMKRFGLEGTVRASFALYNTPAEAEALVSAINTMTS